MKILVTGSAGFIGYSLSKELLRKGYDVTGIDNLNDYYDIDLKMKRTENLRESQYRGHFKFIKFDLRNDFTEYNRTLNDNYDFIYHLAAQAGVRYSLSHPEEYFSNNVTGTYNLLEFIRKTATSQIIFASTSSVYGDSDRFPQVETDPKIPIQFYATTKIMCENLCEMYSKVFNLKITTFRFFTVYGEWGRPDMALFKFAKSIKNNTPIDIYNSGNHERSFTYIEDVIHYLTKVLEVKLDRYSTYNLGNPSSSSLKKMISELENNLGAKSRKNFLKLQFGDVIKTQADATKLFETFGEIDFKSIEYGVAKFSDWYKSFYLL
jgi:UDP-glucuronate 4-epimerase